MLEDPPYHQAASCFAFFHRDPLPRPSALIGCHGFPFFPHAHRRHQNLPCFSDLPFGQEVSWLQGLVLPCYLSLVLPYCHSHQHCFHSFLSQYWPGVPDSWILSYCLDLLCLLCCLHFLVLPYCPDHPYRVGLPCFRVLACCQDLQSCQDVRSSLGLCTQSPPPYYPGLPCCSLAGWQVNLP